MEIKCNENCSPLHCMWLSITIIITFPGNLGHKCRKLVFMKNILYLMAIENKNIPLENMNIHRKDIC